MIVSRGRTIWFSPSDAASTAMHELLSAAVKSLDVMMYALTDATAVSEMIAAKGRGASVRVILDESQANPHSADAMMTAATEVPMGGTTELAQIARLRAAGIAPLIGESTDGQIIHSKYAVIDGMTVFWGSLNWSLSAPLQCNVSATETDPAVVAAFAIDFESNWKRLGGS